MGGLKLTALYCCTYSRVNVMINSLQLSNREGTYKKMKHAENYNDLLYVHAFIGIGLKGSV